MADKLTTEALESYNDDALATIAVGMAEEGKRLIENAGLAQFELEKRMEQSGATKLDTASWTGVLASKGYTHKIEDNDAFCTALLGAGVSTEKMNAEVWPFPPPPVRRWDQRALRELHKLGGKVAEVIDQYRRSTPNRKALVLKAKPDAMTEQEREAERTQEAADVRREEIGGTDG